MKETNRFWGHHSGQSPQGVAMIVPMSMAISIRVTKYPMTSLLCLGELLVFSLPENMHPRKHWKCYLHSCFFFSLKAQYKFHYLNGPSAFEEDFIFSMNLVGCYILAFSLLTHLSTMSDL